LKLVGLKSHDCHILMQQLLPVAIRGILPKNVRQTITRLCAFFVRNPSVSLSPTLTRIEKVEHHIRIKAHKPIALRFWVESGVSVLCG